jgi:hypothetical protein
MTGRWPEGGPGVGGQRPPLPGAPRRTPAAREGGWGPALAAAPSWPAPDTWLADTSPTDGQPPAAAQGSAWAAQHGALQAVVACRAFRVVVAL